MAASRWPKLFSTFWILVYIPNSLQLILELQQDYQLWADTFSRKLLEVSQTATSISSLEKQFKENGAHLIEKNGADLVSQFATEMDKMLQEKVEAVERLVDIAENAHMDYDPEPGVEVLYYNAKQLNEYDDKGELKKERDDKGNVKYVYRELNLEENDHFNNIPVNLSISTVHVPTNVYQKAPSVLEGIAWSEKLDEMFRFNYEKDPTLTWQYFGSATGFFRNFPGMKWQVVEDGLDLFDCRTRTWYIQGAASPKDMVIAIDASGSMTGLRIEIAKQTVGNILDSLSDDDFVNVFQFNDTVLYMEPCFNQTMVQANLDNKKRLRDALDSLNANTKGIANYEVALTEAFELLAKINNSEQGAQCNQAIMLITDGSPYYYEHVFKKYNWPEKHVRVFTYLIGREVTQNREVKWMACENKGYFAHVSTLADVQEHVMKYIHVMSRPMVLAQNHTTIWTGVYLDMSDPKAEYWNWELEKNKKKTEHQTIKTLRLMTSVAQPVFDMKNSSSNFSCYDHILESNKSCEIIVRNNGNLLGVMGTDVPVKELMKFTPPYKLGVNSYSFAITNNGYILFHPDLRPMHRNLPKPNYNSVDLAEVEFDNNFVDNPFSFNNHLLSRTHVLRTEMINRLPSSMEMTVKTHYDNMKRIAIRNQKYYYEGIIKTPFTLGLAFASGYGFYEVAGKKKVDEIAIDREFSGLNWKIPPHWVYCRLTNEEARMDRRDMIKLYIGRGQNNSDTYSNCNAELMEYLAFDALVTMPILAQWEQTQDKPKQYGIRSLFLSTRSGLTRYIDIPDKELEDLMNSENITEESFLDNHDGSIDEVYYKRAAEAGNGTFIFSVPFDASHIYNISSNISLESLTLITGSSVVIVRDRKFPGKTGVAAVVGIQFRYDKFKELMWNASKSSPSCRQSEDCGCARDSVICYLLDDHGYIIATNDFNEVGKFFGEFHSDVMTQLVIKGIYREIQLYDFQGMCPRHIDKSSDGPIFFNSFHNMIDILKWTWKHTIWFMLKMTFYSWWQDAYAEHDGPISDGSHKPKNTSEHLGEPTDWYPCDMEFNSYLLESDRNELPYYFKIEDCDSCNKEFSAHKVQSTNLVLLMVDSLCSCDVDSGPMSFKAKPIRYNSTDLCGRITADIYRRRPSYCFPSHENERRDVTCDEASCFKLSLLLFIGTVGILFLQQYYS